MEAPAENYTNRLEREISSGRVTLVTDADE